MKARRDGDKCVFLTAELHRQVKFAALVANETIGACVARLLVAGIEREPPFAPNGKPWSREGEAPPKPAEVEKTAEQRANELLTELDTLG